LGLTPAHTVADIGSGTGFLTELFVRNGNVTFAIEPNADMRAAAEAYLGEYANFRSIDAAAEATSLPATSVDFVTAGQAFHWFDPEAARSEFIRILKCGGYVALVWNQRRVEDSVFNREYQDLIHRYQIDHEAVKSRNVAATDSTTLQRFFGRSDYHVRMFDNPQHLDRQGLLDRIASSSYMPLEPHPSYLQMREAIDKLFYSHQKDGRVVIAYNTEVYFGSPGQ
jgi:SAM-dependent methyltransferase